MSVLKLQSAKYPFTFSNKIYIYRHLLPLAFISVTSLFIEVYVTAERFITVLAMLEGKKQRHNLLASREICSRHQERVLLNRKTVIDADRVQQVD